MSKNTKNSHIGLIIFIIILVLAIAGGAGFYFYQRQQPKKAAEKFQSEYKFVKNKYIGIGLGAWCFFLTAFACITGMYTPGSPFQTAMNIITPIVLISLGLIMPLLAKKNNSK